MNWAARIESNPGILVALRSPNRCSATSSTSSRTRRWREPAFREATTWRTLLNGIGRRPAPGTKAMILPSPTASPTLHRTCIAMEAPP